MSLRSNSTAAGRHQHPQSDADERSESPATPLIVVAGIPGAGKTEALKALRVQSPLVRVSDPEYVRWHLHRLVPWLPYAYGRPVVHAIAHLWVLTRIVNRGGGPLVVHDPGTRRWSRRLIANLAMALGYCPKIIYIDVARDMALKGQAQRGRVVRSRAFKRHWQRWLSLRHNILETEEIYDDEPWCRVVLSRRGVIVDDVLGLLSSSQDESS